MASEVKTAAVDSDLKSLLGEFQKLAREVNAAVQSKEIAIQSAIARFKKAQDAAEAALEMCRPAAQQCQARAQADGQNGVSDEPEISGADCLRPAPAVPGGGSVQPTVDGEYEGAPVGSWSFVN
jgi:TATA-binding protein-associated factor Taf7